MVSNIVHPISKKGKAFSFSGKSSRRPAGMMGWIKTALHDPFGIRNFSKNG